MKTTSKDLNDLLFEQLEALTNSDLTPEELDLEMKRADTVVKVSKTIIENGALALQVKKQLDEYGGGNVELPLIGLVDE